MTRNAAPLSYVSLSTIDSSSRYYGQSILSVNLIAIIHPFLSLTLLSSIAIDECPRKRKKRVLDSACNAIHGCVLYVSMYVSELSH